MNEARWSDDLHRRLRDAIVSAIDHARANRFHPAQAIKNRARKPRVRGHPSLAANPPPRCSYFCTASVLSFLPVAALYFSTYSSVSLRSARPILR